MTHDTLKPPTVSRCPKCGFMSGGQATCEACGAVLPPVREYLATGPGRTVPIKREATGGWLLSVALVFFALVICVAGLWYWFAPEIATLRGQISYSVSSKLASLSAGRSAPQDSIPEAKLAPASDRSPSPRRGTPVSPSTPEKELPGTPAAKKMAAVMGQFFGVSMGSDRDGESTSGMTSRNPRQIEFSAEPTPQPVLAPWSNRRSTDPKVPIVLREESFATGRLPAPVKGSSGVSSQEVRRAIDAWGGTVMVAPTPFNNDTVSGTSAPASTDVARAVTDLTDQTFDAAVLHSSQPVVVDFWAPWCAPCRAFNPVMESVAQGMGDRVKFYRVNVDENKALVRRYQVEALPTVMVFRSGTIRKRVEGGMSAPAFRSWVDASAN